MYYLLQVGRVFTGTHNFQAWCGTELYLCLLKIFQPHQQPFPTLPTIYLTNFITPVSTNLHKLHWHFTLHYSSPHLGIFLFSTCTALNFCFNHLVCRILTHTGVKIDFWLRSTCTPVKSTGNKWREGGCTPN